MLQKSNSYIINNKNLKPEEIVNIPVSLFKSMEGKYFVGQTNVLKVGDGIIGWAALTNPPNSNVNLYTNVFTISNFSDDYLIAEVWLNTTPCEKGCTSHKVSPTNTAIKPLPKNKVNIHFVESTTKAPKGGVNVYNRIVSPNTTLVAEEDGKFISAPGGNYTLVIKSPSSNCDNVIVAFGWWEKSKC